jgi:hypothetical protein
MRPLVEWVPLRRVIEARGALTQIDLGRLPFTPARVFFVTNVPAGARRGGHAHREGEQILVCASGHIEVELRHGLARETVMCGPDSPGLLIRADVWAQQRYETTDSTLIVLCSHPYDPSSYTDGGITQ